MDEIQTPLPDVTDLQAQCQWLRKQIQITLLLLILVSGILALFLQRQNKYVTQDLNSVKPVIENYTKNQGPMMDDLIKRLLDYSHAHADFAPIAKKYGLDQLNVPPATTAPKK